MIGELRIETEAGDATIRIESHPSEHGKAILHVNGWGNEAKTYGVVSHSLLTSSELRDIATFISAFLGEDS